MSRDWPPASRWVGLSHPSRRHRSTAHAAPPRRPAARFSVLGNELAGDAGIEAHLSADEYARDLLSLRREVDALWPTKPPLLLAPDTAFDAEWAKLFLSQLRAASKEGGGGGGDGDGDGDGDGGAHQVEFIAVDLEAEGVCAVPRRVQGGRHAPPLAMRPLLPHALRRQMV